MSKGTFQYLCDKVRSTIEREHTRLRKAIPTEKHVAITLWFYATGADYRVIGHLFRVSKSTVSLVVKSVSSAILELLPQYIRLPTGDAVREVIDGFADFIVLNGSVCSQWSCNTHFTTNI